MTYYVYDLIDPRDGKAFYVGKGKGRRSSQHTQEAKRGKPGKKCERIREILSAGHTVTVAVIKEFESEARAYAFEKRRIAAIGCANLTNIAPGGGAIRSESSRFIKPISREEMLAMFQRIAARPEPKERPWAAALHRAVVRNLPSLLENRA